MEAFLKPTPLKKEVFVMSVSKSIRQHGWLEAAPQNSVSVECNLWTEQEMIPADDHDNPNDLIPGRKHLRGEIRADQKLAFLAMNREPLTLRLDGGMIGRILLGNIRGSAATVSWGEILN
jgi:hypothetical protein